MIHLLLLFGSSDTTIAVSAVIVSVAGIIIGVVYNSKTFTHYKEHNILSVAPLIDTSITTDDSDGKVKLVIELINEGLGPAIIDSITYRLDGSDFIDCNKILTLFIEKFGSNSFEYSSVRGIVEYTNFIMGPNNKDELLKIVFINSILKDDIQNFLKAIDIRVLYKDIYKQKRKMIHKLYS